MSDDCLLDGCAFTSVDPDARCVRCDSVRPPSTLVGRSALSNVRDLVSWQLELLERRLPDRDAMVAAGDLIPTPAPIVYGGDPPEVTGSLSAVSLQDAMRDLEAGPKLGNLQIVLSPGDLERLRTDLAFKQEAVRAMIDGLRINFLPILTSGFVRLGEAFRIAADRLSRPEQTFDSLASAPFGWYRPRLRFTSGWTRPGYHFLYNPAAYGDSRFVYRWRRLPRKLKKALRNRWQHTLRGRREHARVRSFDARRRVPSEGA